MKLNITQKLIKDMCGEVSFKRGASFYRKGKVKVNQLISGECTAVVTGPVDFDVRIKWDITDHIKTECSCPTLVSFQKDCQHIAAVLIKLYEDEQKGSLIEKESPGLSLLSIFDQNQARPSQVQPYFDDRQLIKAEFICKPVSIEEGSMLFGVEIKIKDFAVLDIRQFLEDMKTGTPAELSSTFIFTQESHCFERETDAVIKQLIHVANDEKSYGASLLFPKNKGLLPIPPSSWERLLPLMEKASSVNISYNGQIYNGIQVTNDTPPLTFDVLNNNEGLLIKVKGVENITLLHSYQSIIFKGNLVQMENKDWLQLSQLIQWIDAGSNQIAVSRDQIGDFLEKGVPSLQRFGTVNLAPAVAMMYKRTPLIAKLYLDRLKNRLLVGIEFHYEHITIDPFQNKELATGTLLVRDQDKEEKIIKLIEESSFIRTDGGFYLHDEELEYNFLYHTLPKLQKLVQVYATTAVRSRIFRENPHPIIRVKIQKDRVNWLEFTFKLDGISNDQIKGVLQAIEEKRKYYRLRNGSLLSLEKREFDDIRRFLETAQVKGNELDSGLSLPFDQCIKLLDTVTDNQVFSLDSSFHKFLEKLQNPQDADFPVPREMGNILKEYQVQGYLWMKTLASYGFGGVLADDMGLGKTLQSLTFIFSELYEIRKSSRPVLIVCPSSLMYNWLKEIKKFTPSIRAVIVDGNQKQRASIQKKYQDFDVIITSYPLLRRDVKWYENKIFPIIFFDEAQAFKNPVTQTARAVKRLQAGTRFALTGTPVENSLEELWSIFHIVLPELFLGLKEFSKLSRETISRKIRPFLLRRVKEDVLSEFPKKIEAIETTELLQEQKQLYAAYLAKLKHDTLKHLDQDTIRKNRIKILAGLTRLRQICCHPSLFLSDYKGGSAKFEQLLQLIDDAKHSRKRVLIFSQFTKMLDLVGRQLTLQGTPYFYLDGQTPSEERLTICDRFNDGERDFLLISLKAGGTGLNLMSADTVILYDTWWNPAVEEQAADRAYRIGQTRDVRVIKLISKGTIEEKIDELQKRKKHLIEEVIKSEENSLSSLSDQDLREIFK